MLKWDIYLEKGDFLYYLCIVTKKTQDYGKKKSITHFIQ